jgi:ABC-type sugar transport system ATPase subunit
VAVILVSSELDEIYALSDRIAIMYEGRFTGFRPPDVPVEELGLLMAGIDGSTTPEAPESAEMHEATEAVEAAEEPGTPEVPEAPETAEAAETPKAPETPEAPEPPEAPETEAK